MTQKHKGYIMSDRKYMAHFQSPDDEVGIPMRVEKIESSGSPSTVWAGIKRYLHLDQTHPTSELKDRGWMVLQVETPKEEEPQPEPEPIAPIATRVVPIKGKTDNIRMVHDSGWLDGPSHISSKDSDFQFESDYKTEKPASKFAVRMLCSAMVAGFILGVIAIILQR